jgi:hypothetical protein
MVSWHTKLTLEYHSILRSHVSDTVHPQHCTSSIISWWSFMRYCLHDWASRRNRCQHPKSTFKHCSPAIAQGGMYQRICLSTPSSTLLDSIWAGDIDSGKITRSFITALRPVGHHRTKSKREHTSVTRLEMLLRPPISMADSSVNSGVVGWPKGENARATIFFDLE